MPDQMKPRSKEDCSKVLTLFGKAIQKAGEKHSDEEMVKHGQELEKKHRIDQ